MHVDKIYTYGNIGYQDEVITYYYQIKPINSLFTSKIQHKVLIENMVDKLRSINMPGMILIKPKKIVTKKILDKYEDVYVKHGRPEFYDLKEEYMESLKDILTKRTRYRYEIYLMFCDGREELKRRFKISLFSKNNDPMPKRLQDITHIAEEEIYKRLSVDLSAEKLTESKIAYLNNYLAIPFENKIVDYYTTETATELEYDYQPLKSYEYKKMYTRTLIVSKFLERSIQKYEANDIINSLQLEVFPTDTIIKFDLVHSSAFKQEMRVKDTELNKKNDRYKTMTDKEDKEAVQAKKMIQIADSKIESIAESKIRWQLMVRVRANDVTMLNKRSDTLKKKFEKNKIILSQEIGEQLTLANHLFPSKNEFHKYVKLTEMEFFAQFNYLGGLYIGEEEEGIIITYTMPGGLPIFYEISAPLLGHTKTNAATTVYIGSTGSGKTQLADHEALVMMIFYGMRILTLDPKDDRSKKINRLGDRAAVLRIGSEECPDGMFDCYLLYKDNLTHALAKAQNDIVAILHAVDPDARVGMNDIRKAHDDMIQDYKNGIIKQLTFTYLIQKYDNYDHLNAEQIKGMMINPKLRLLFAKEDTDIDSTFNLKKFYNLITFSDMPLMNEKKEAIAFNPNQLEHNIFAILFSRVEEVIGSFMKLFGGEENMLIFDEAKMIRSIPSGDDIINTVNRQGRSWQTHFRLISQGLSDIPEGVMNNVGQLMIGGISSQTEIDYICNQLGLDDSSNAKTVMVNKNKTEGVLENDQYNFIYRDYNNRTCVTKLIFPKAFKEIFRTLKDEEDVKDAKIS